MIKNITPYKILVIEDNPGDFAIIEEYLHEEFLKPVIHQVSTFKEAKLLLAGIKMYFDVILLDLSLPDRSGMELISEMITLSLDCPIIVLTGYADISFSVKSLSLGISDYLLKDDLSSVPLYKSILYSIERKKTLSTLEESEKRYSDLFHLSPQPMWVFELDTLRFLDVNDAAIKHYGYTREEFLQMTIDQLVLEEDIEKLNQIITASKQQEQFFFRGVISHKTKSGATIYVEIHSNKILFKARQARLSLVSDVTERIKYIKAIEKQNEKLQEISWIQSHVVRAPLARMMGIVNLIKDLKVVTPEGSQLLKHFDESATELDNVIRDIANKSHQISIDNLIV